MVATTLPAKHDERHALLSHLVDGVRQGKTFSQLSEEHGIPRSTINNWLLSKVPDEYLPAKEAGIVAHVTECIGKLEGASSHLDVARAREVARLWCWILERQVQSYASKQEISGPGGGPIELTSFERAQRFAYLQRQAIDIEPDAVQHEERALTDLSTVERPESLE